MWVPTYIGWANYGRVCCLDASACRIASCPRAFKFFGWPSFAITSLHDWKPRRAVSRLRLRFDARRLQASTVFRRLAYVTGCSALVDSSDLVSIAAAVRPSSLPIPLDPASRRAHRLVSPVVVSKPEHRVSLRQIGSKSSAIRSCGPA